MRAIFEAMPADLRESLISDMTIAAVIDQTNKIEAYERRYPSLSEDEVLKLIRSKPWNEWPEEPEFLMWRDWFLLMTMKEVRESLKSHEIEMTEAERDYTETLICNTMDDFPAWKSRGGYYRQRIGFRKHDFSHSDNGD